MSEFTGFELLVVPALFLPDFGEDMLSVLRLPSNGNSLGMI